MKVTINLAGYHQNLDRYLHFGWFRLLTQVNLRTNLRKEIRSFRCISNTAPPDDKLKDMVGYRQVHLTPSP